MIKGLLKIIFLLISGAAGGIFAVQYLWPNYVERPLFLEYRLDQSPIYVTERKETRIQENTALKEAAEKVQKIIAGIESVSSKGLKTGGSGLILTSDGLIVTLSDSMPANATNDVYLEDVKVGFKILKRDESTNLALVKAEDRSGLPTSSFYEFEKLKLGERVFLLGFKAKEEYFVNEGIVRSFTDEMIETNIMETSQISGSPLFDIEGNILGVCYLSKEGRVVAVPISKIKEFSGL